EYMLLVAWSFFVISVYRTSPIAGQRFVPRALMTMLLSFIIGLPLYWLSGWQPPTSPAPAASNFVPAVPDRPKHEQSKTKQSQDSSKNAEPATKSGKTATQVSKPS